MMENNIKLRIVDLFYNALHKSLRVKSVCIFLPVFLFPGLELKAQTTMDAEIRPRVEYRHGFRKPLEDTLKTAFVTLQRTRFSLGHNTEKFSLYVCMQDARVFGQSKVTDSESNIKVFEAWGELKLFQNLSFIIGRQAPYYDDGRLISFANWANSGKAHDMSTLKYSGGKIKAHLSYAYNNDGDINNEETYDVNTYKQLALFWGSYSFLDGYTLTAIAIQDAFQKSDNYKKNYFRNTIGTNLVLQNDSNALSFRLGAYYQFGKTNAIDKRELRSVVFITKANYKLNKFLSTITGFDFYTGNTKGSKINRTHARLYGGHHVLNGLMEYYFTIPEGGLLDGFAGFSLKPTGLTSIELTYHHFRLQHTMVASNKDINGSLGSEFDLILNYQFTKQVSLQGGLCYYLMNRNFELLKKTDKAQLPYWSYVSFSFKPKLFDSAKSNK